MSEVQQPGHDLFKFTTVRLTDGSYIIISVLGHEVKFKIFPRQDESREITGDQAAQIIGEKAKKK